RISSEKLTKLARQSLENIKKHKAADLKSLADSERAKFNKRIEKKRNSLWSKIFGYTELPNPTDEELIKMHEGECGG
ncbi:hypothetical protein, partial [Acinetobacter nosocomialis]|uniref:hypothetical protein n=1 Tax=Acinetobacter nosocomialis TaxID=106654 RepID=UPI001C094E3B